MSTLNSNISHSLDNDVTKDIQKIREKFSHSPIVWKKSPKVVDNCVPAIDGGDEKGFCFHVTRLSG